MVNVTYYVVMRAQCCKPGCLPLTAAGQPPASPHTPKRNAVCFDLSGNCKCLGELQTVRMSRGKCPQRPQRRAKRPRHPLSLPPLASAHCGARASALAMPQALARCGRVGRVLLPFLVSVARLHVGTAVVSRRNPAAAVLGVSNLRRWPLIPHSHCLTAFLDSHSLIMSSFSMLSQSVAGVPAIPVSLPCFVRVHLVSSTSSSACFFTAGGADACTALRPRVPHGDAASPLLKP